MRVRGAWLGRRESRAWQRLLAPLAWLYGAGAWLDRTAWRRGWRTPRRLPCKVVSVGNLSVGGSAKTPTAAWLASRLQRRGHKVVLASRGYGRQGRGAVCVVSDGRHVHADVETAGDEALLLAAHAAGVPVLVGRDRGVAGLRAVAAFGAEVLVLDDGFQHHRLARDLDLVLVDAALGFGNRRVLPLGPLREPAGALRQADAVGVVDGPLREDDAAWLEARAPDALRFRVERRPVGLRPLAGGRPVAPELHEAEVGLLAGIARPASLRRSLESLGARVVAERTFPDHHRYRPRDLSGLADEAARWITTEKDALKILPAWVEDAQIDALVIDVVVDDEERLLDEIETRLR